MTLSRPGALRLALIVGLCLSSTAHAAPLTADDAVRVALEKNVDVVNSQAGVLEARGGLYTAYSGILPRLSASFNRNGSWIDNQTSDSLGTAVGRFDSEAYS